MITVRYYYREYRKGGVSIEGIFNLMKVCLTGKVNITEYHLDPSISRLSNIFKARERSEGINHITGDVYYLAIGFKGKKNVITIHDLGHYETLKYSWYKQMLYRFLWLYLPFKKAAIITVVSEFTREKMLQYFPFTENKIRLVPNPVKTLFKYAPKDRLNDKPRILQIGTGRHKNLKNLVEAVNNLGVHLDIVADVEIDVAVLLKKYNISHTVYGRLTDEEIYELYKQCDVLFFASTYEGFGMPIIEAQAIGRAVITSNFGAMLEVAGNTAVLVDPYKPLHIKVAIEKLVNNPDYYKQMVSAGVENIKKYEANNIAAQYYKIYQELSDND